MTPTPPHPRVGEDPLERKIAHALDAAGIEYFTDYEGEVPEHLDFYLYELDVFIEIKGGHSERIADQMSRAHNVIAVQGMKSVVFILSLLALKKKPVYPPNPAYEEWAEKNPEAAAAAEKASRLMGRMYAQRKDGMP